MFALGITKPLIAMNKESPQYPRFNDAQAIQMAAQQQRYACTASSKNILRPVRTSGKKTSGSKWIEPHNLFDLESITLQKPNRAFASVEEEMGAI
jgi:hypothetical protein